MRWRHPERGDISPGEFIPLAEETRLIVPMTYQILDQACLQARTWQLENAGHRLSVSVNLSGRRMAHPDLIAHVKMTLERTGLPPQSLCLELTETAVCENPEIAVKAMRELCELGIHPAIVLGTAMQRRSDDVGGVGGAYRSFTVASAIAASMAPMSQNRTTTCVSVHPFSRK